MKHSKPPSKKIERNSKRKGVFGGFKFSLPKFKNHKSKSNLKVRTSLKESESKPSGKKFYYSKKSKNIPDSSKIRVFKPKEGRMISEKIKNKIPTGNKKKKKKQFLFGFKNFTDSAKKITSRDFLTNFNLLLVQFRLKDRLNGFFSYSIVAILVFFMVYLSFFDTNFLVNEYEIIFTDVKSENEIVYTSFLADQEIEKILKGFNQGRAFGFIPHNQYWFVNDLNLTLVARNIIPEVREVVIQERIWPNRLVIEIKTEPILATLGIYERNQKRYWRVNQRGQVFSQDTAFILENLIFIDSPVTLTSQTADGSIGQITLQDYELENSQTQLNRLWFANWLWNRFENKEVDILETRFPTLLDTNVIITTRNDTKMYFDSDIDRVPREILTARLEQIFRSEINRDLREGKIAYIDFRLETRRVVVCYRTEKCAE